MTVGARNSTITSVAQSDSDVELLAIGERHGFTVFNDTEADLYLVLGSSAASTTSFTVKMAAGSYYEGPWGYDGPVRGIWSAAGAGAARITEIGA